MIKIGVTGHRPKRLKKIAEVNRITDWIDANLQPFNDFIMITGMAQGFDQIAALEALHFGGRIWSYFPYRHKLSDLEDYLVTKADKVRYEREDWSMDCYDVRDRRIVDDCDVLFACWDGKKHGGTWNTIEYARKKGKTIVYFNEKDLKEKGLI